MIIENNHFVWLYVKFTSWEWDNPTKDESYAREANAFIKELPKPSRYFNMEQKKWCINKQKAGQENIKALFELNQKFNVAKKQSELMEEKANRQLLDEMFPDEES